MTIARELSDGGGAPAESAPSSAPATGAPASGESAASGGSDPKEEQAKREEMYEYFLDRFKRDLVAEREQMGHLIIDTP